METGSHACIGNDTSGRRTNTTGSSSPSRSSGRNARNDGIMSSDQPPVAVSAGLLGDEDWRGMEGEISGRIATRKGDAALMAGGRGFAGQGDGYVEATATPFVRADVGNISFEASKDYGISADSQGVYKGGGSTNLNAGLNVPVGAGNLSVNINQSLNRFKNMTSGTARFTMPF